MPSSPPPPASPPDEDLAPRERWLFLLSGGLLTLALLVAIGRERHWGEPQMAVELVAPRADGLQEGMEVRLSGMPIGRVDSLRLLNDARVAATLQINARYRHLIGPRSRAQGAQVGLVGQTFVSLTPDPSPGGEGSQRPLPPLAYDPPPDLNQLVAELARSGQKIDRTLALASNLLQTQVPSSLGSLQTSMGKLSGSMGDLSSMSKTVAGETRSTVPSVRALTNTLQRETVQVGPAVRRTLAKAEQTLTRADQTAVTASQASREAQLLLQQARPVLLPTLENLKEITGVTSRLVRLLGGLGLLEPGTATPRPAPTKHPSDPMDPYKVHPTSPDPSPDRP
ncbi:MAG: MlaD family protein [Cyanobacteriota bacterium]|jgi:phospholipid/cholesterol/gamma-HCH transport system substrate-binding protein